MLGPVIEILSVADTALGGSAKFLMPCQSALHHAVFSLRGLVCFVLIAASRGQDVSDFDLLTDFSAESNDTYASIVDLVKYPIHDLDGEVCQRLIAEAQMSWTSIGAVDFPGFVREELLEQLAAEVAPSVGLLSQHRQFAHAVNLSLSDAVDEEQFKTDVHAIAADQVPRQLLVRQLYDSPRVAAFFARVIGRPRLHQYTDEFQKLNVMYQHDGGHRSWHYDGSDFVATLLIQQATSGGEFEFAPFIRGVHDSATGKYDEQLPAVHALYAGTYTGTRLMTRAAAGSMQLFNGERSLHRVRAPRGPRTRISAVLSYDTKEACQQKAPNLELQVRLYGERIKTSAVWEASQAARRQWCGGAAPTTPPLVLI